MPNARKKQREDFLKRWGSVKAFGRELTRPTEDLYTSKTMPNRGAVQTAKLVKYLPEMMLKPMAKVGGAIRSTARGEAPGITQEDLISGVMAGVVGGKPGGLPAGSVGTGMTRSEALQTLGTSARNIRRFVGNEGAGIAYKTATNPTKVIQNMRNAKLHTKDVRAMAADLRRTPKELFEPLTSVKYTDRLPPTTTGRNVRIGQRPGDSKIQLAPEAGSSEWFHELTHSAAAKGQAGARAEGKPTIQQYMSDLLESTTAAGDDIVAKTPSMQGRSFYEHQPIETHARGVGESLTKYGKDFTEKQFNRLFTNTAKKVMHDVGKKAPKLYKKSATTLGKHYKNIRKMDADLMKELGITNPKSKSKKELPGLPIKVEDIIEMIKKLPKGEVKKIKIKRKAD